MKKNQAPHDSRSQNERFPVAAPLELPASGRRIDPLMRPAQVVSPEIASLLPPVGIYRELAAAAPAEVPRAVPTRRTKNRPAAPLNVPATIALVVTAVGVGAAAVIPLFSRGEPARRLERASSPEVALPERSVRAPEGPSTTGEQAAGTAQVLASSVQASANEENDANLDVEIGRIEQWLRERDISAATAKIEQLARRQWQDAQRKRVEQYIHLADAVRGFWESLNGALDAAPAGRSVSWRGHEAVIVATSKTDLVLRLAGSRKAVPRGDFTNEDVRALADSLLDRDDPLNQRQLGAFLLVTGHVTQARRLWESAAASGADVSLLLQLAERP